MKVSELIKHLKELDPELLVVVDGYEENLRDPILYEVNVKEVKKYEYWSGKYERVLNNQNAIRALAISRKEKENLHEY